MRRRGRGFYGLDSRQWTGINANKGLGARPAYLVGPFGAEVAVRHIDRFGIDAAQGPDPGCGESARHGHPRRCQSEDADAAFRETVLKFRWRIRDVVQQV